jgi:hypothetical protein
MTKHLRYCCERRTAIWVLASLVEAHQYEIAASISFLSELCKINGSKSVATGAEPQGDGNLISCAWRNLGLCQAIGTHLHRLQRSVHARRCESEPLVERLHD